MSFNFRSKWIAKLFDIQPTNQLGTLIIEVPTVLVERQAIQFRVAPFVVTHHFGGINYHQLIKLFLELLDKLTPFTKTFLNIFSCQMAVFSQAKTLVIKRAVRNIKTKRRTPLD